MYALQNSCSFFIASLSEQVSVLECVVKIGCLKCEADSTEERAERLRGLANCTKAAPHVARERWSAEGGNSILGVTTPHRCWSKCNDAVHIEAAMLLFLRKGA